MRRVFKTMIIAIACIAIGYTTACADNDKPIQQSELPAKAQIVLSKYFSQHKIVFTTLDIGIGSRNYNVILQNGTKLEFDKKGSWTEIDCKQDKVPVELLPLPIIDYIRKNYPGEFVKKIEKQRKEYEVELSNDIDITFNKHFQVIDID